MISSDITFKVAGTEEYSGCFDAMQGSTKKTLADASKYKTLTKVLCPSSSSANKPTTLASLRLRKYEQIPRDDSEAVTL